MIHNSPRFVFFGSSDFSVMVLEELKKRGFIPSLIVAIPDSRQGRGMKLTPPPIKAWAQKIWSNTVEILQPEKLDTSFVGQLPHANYHLFIVAGYGKFLSKELLEIPKHGTLNFHPSLLPKFRGANPIAHQILAREKEVGVTIMLVDEKMDHGPILAQRKLEVRISKITQNKLRGCLAQEGGILLAETIPKWIDGEITPHEQDHDKATFAPKIKKGDGLIDLGDNPELNYRKFRAYFPWPGIYFFHNNKRVKITDAEFKDENFVIKKVVPEGKKETYYKNFLQNQKSRNQFSD